MIDIMKGERAVYQIWAVPKGAVLLNIRGHLIDIAIHWHQNIDEIGRLRRNIENFMWALR